MAKGYWIAHVDVHDAEAYKLYIQANGAAFAKFGARFLVRGGTHVVVAGKVRSRNIVLEFPSYAAAIACHESRRNIAKRRNCATPRATSIL